VKQFSVLSSQFSVFKPLVLELCPGKLRWFGTPNGVQWKSCEMVSAFVTNSGSTRSALTEITLS
jgi:hypothetical protein